MICDQCVTKRWQWQIPRSDAQLRLFFVSADAIRYVNNSWIRLQHWHQFSSLLSQWRKEIDAPGIPSQLLSWQLPSHACQHADRPRVLAAEHPVKQVIWRHGRTFRWARRMVLASRVLIFDPQPFVPSLCQTAPPRSPIPEGRVRWLLNGFFLSGACVYTKNAKTKMTSHKCFEFTGLLRKSAGMRRLARHYTSRPLIFLSPFPRGTIINIS